MAAAPDLARPVPPLTSEKPKLEELQNYIEKKKLRLALQSQARAMGKLEEQFEQRCFDYLKAHGGPKRTKTVCGYRLTIKDEQLNVSWKNEYLRVMGVQAAFALSASQPTEEVVVIEAPAA